MFANFTKNATFDCSLHFLALHIFCSNQKCKSICIWFISSGLNSAWKFWVSRIFSVVWKKYVDVFARTNFELFKIQVNASKCLKQFYFEANENQSKIKSVHCFVSFLGEVFNQYEIEIWKMQYCCPALEHYNFWLSIFPYEKQWGLGHNLVRKCYRKKKNSNGQTVIAFWFNWQNYESH